MDKGKVLKTERELDFSENRKIINRNHLDSFLKKNFSMDVCKEVRKVIKQCFSKGIDVAFIFLNKSKTNGVFKNACFLPAFFDNIKLIPTSCVMDDIGSAIALPGIYLKYGLNIEDSIKASIVSTAEEKGYWDRIYAFGVLNKDGNSE